MKQALSYASLTEMLNWAESAVGADWSNLDDLGPAVLPRLQSRLNIALLAEEVDGVSAAAPILSAPFTVPINWSDFEDDVQVAAVKLAIRRTRENVVEVREQVQSESAPSKDKLLETMQNAYDRSIPLIEGLMADTASIDKVERENLADLLGNAYGTLAWGYGLFDFTICAELFDLIVKLEAENPNVIGLCNGLTFALLPLMPDSDSDEDEDDLILARERISVFVEIFDRATGDDDASWQVNSAGCLADLTRYMSEDEAVQAAVKASARVLDWSASAWTEMNAAYAIYHILDALHRVRSKDEAAIDTRLQQVLEAYRTRASSKLRHKLVGSIANMITRPGIAVPVRDLLVVELCGFLETAHDAEMIEMVVPNLAGVEELIGAEKLWSSVRKAKSPLVQKFWLSGLANRPPEIVARETADEHLRHLREIRSAANDPVISLWTGALLSIGIALVARNEAQPLRNTISEFADDPSCPMDHWLDAAGIAVLGAGQEAPDWLVKICALTEAAAAEEPINPVLRAGLSYFLAAALTERKSISGADFEAQLNLLERVTVSVTPND